MGLFKPAWMSDDNEKAVRAVEKISSQPKLSAIVLSPSASLVVRLKALEKIKNRTGEIEFADQDVLFAILEDESSKHPAFCNEDYLAASEGLEDQLFAQEVAQRVNRKIAMSDMYSDDARLEAANRLTDQVFAQKIRDEIAEKAIRSREENLYRFAESNKNPVYERLEAVDKMMDRRRAQEIYTSIAEARCRYSGYGGARIAAAERLTDQTLAQRVYSEVADGQIKYPSGERAKAIEKLIDQILLTKIARTNEVVDLRIKAAEKLMDQSIAQEVYIDIAKKHVGDDALRESIVPRITDLSALTACERDGHKWVVTGTHEEVYQEMISGPDFYYFPGDEVVTTYADYKCEVCGAKKSTKQSSTAT